MTKVSAPLKWHGGKSYLAKWIVSLMPERCRTPNSPSKGDKGWVAYVEPFFGGGAVLFANDPEGISEVVNDLSGTLINFWRVLCGDSTREELIRILHFTPVAFDEWRYSVEYFESFCQDELNAPFQNIPLAAEFFTRYRQSRQGLGKDFATLSRNRTRRGMNEQVSAWLSAIDGLPEIHERLKRVVILNNDAMKVIRQQDGPRTHFYCDPPYLHETRTTTSEYGDHEMTIEQHVALLETLKLVKGTFQLSGYSSDLYADFAKRAGWSCVTKEIDNKASSKKTKDKELECLWMNY